MRRVVKKTVLYQCKICKTEYSTLKEVKKCEARGVEKKTFSVGDLVSNIEPRVCWKKSKGYIFRGKVVKIIGPMPADFEYECKWLKGQASRLNSHVFQYEVDYSCPHCKELKTARYFTPEIKKINS